MLREMGQRAVRQPDPLAELLSAAESVSDSIDLDELLEELLGKVREVVGADTAAIWVLEDGGRTLVARAASGLEDEVRQGVRLPVGVGFAGEVAALGAPVVVNTADLAGTADDHPWIAKGVQSMLGVPLVANGALIGVLQVGTLETREFGEYDSQLLQEAAAGIAAAAQVRLLSVERAAAQLLERSLMPAALPKCNGVALAARYVPADRAVGGDWYDVFVLPSGQLWVVTGDVAGHGLHGAVVMGRARSTLRAYALLGGSPAEVLTRTDRKLQHFEPGIMVTAVCACSEPPYEELLVSCAGHPLPVVAGPSGNALVEVPTDPPIGVGPYERSCAEVEFGPNKLLLFYTDGLIERRGESIDQGFGRLLAAVKFGEPEAVCSVVMRRLVGDSIPADDIAIVAMRKDSARA